MIRVLVGSRSSVVRAGLESLVRSIPSLEFAGTIDLFQPAPPELAADVAVIEIGESSDHDRAGLADISIPVILMLDLAESAVVGSALRSGIRGVIPFDATSEEIKGGSCGARGASGDYASVARGAFA